MKDLTINVVGSEGELTIREGKALDPKEPKIVSLSGVLDSPLKWLLKRSYDQDTLVNEFNNPIDDYNCHILVNRDKLTIKLVIDEHNHYQTTILGSMEVHPMFERFSVNTGRYLSNFEMAQLFKMNRTAFETQDQAMRLVSELQNFRAKVDREVEKKDDNRGNKRDLVAQVVESNLPDTFNLVMPIFKGTQKQTFPVEVYIKADDFSCTLISPVANDLIEEMRDSQIDKVLTEIRETAPDIVIIEQ